MGITMWFVWHVTSESFLSDTIDKVVYSFATRDVCEKKIKVI